MVADSDRRPPDDAEEGPASEANEGEVSDGFGCVEMWEYLSERRRED